MRHRDPLLVCLALWMGLGGIVGTTLGDLIQDWLRVTVAGGNEVLFQRSMHVLFLVLMIVTYVPAIPMSLVEYFYR